jgi:hypothetical protein
MREFRTHDGNIIHLPETVQRVDDYHCDCHKQLGNDFWFLPKASCLRADKRCNNPEPYREEK